MSGIVHHDCPNSGNPYHECHDQCFKRISSGDVPKKEKKRFGFGKPACSKETPLTSRVRVIAGNRSPLPSYYGKRMDESDESPSFSSSDDSFNANLPTPRSTLHGNETAPGIKWLPMSPSFAVYCKKDCFSSRIDHREGEAPILDEMPSKTRLKTPLSPDTRPRKSEHRTRNQGPRSKTPEPRGSYLEPPRSRIPQTQPVPHRSLESAGLKSLQKGETRPHIPQTQPTSFNIGGNYHYAAQASKYHANKADSVYTKYKDKCVILYPEILLSPQENLTSRSITMLPQKSRTPLDKQSKEQLQLPVECHSFTPSEIECMKALKIYETGEEMKSMISESYVSVGGYKVRASVSSTLQKILDKHGDIASGSKLQSLRTKSYSLETLAAVVLELQSTPLKKLKQARVLEMLSVVIDAESVKIRAGWLREILNEILEAAHHYDGHETTVVEKEGRERDMLLEREEMEKIQKEVRLKEKEAKDFRKGVMEMAGRLGELEMKRARLEKRLAFLSSKVEKFEGESLLENVF
ncbi:Phospholipase-like [Arabidopsis suecica]|uniref:Phospholipase-like n=1 Tax=Arabidopsis suecica TaxID=45249 RepID=A0A8T2ELL4_ARASU|nr:Phospholipase-like [Arabidopsis suecica]